MPPGDLSNQLVIGLLCESLQRGMRASVLFDWLFVDMLDGCLFVSLAVRLHKFGCVVGLSLLLMSAKPNSRLNPTVTAQPANSQHQ